MDFVKLKRAKIRACTSVLGLSTVKHHEYSSNVAPRSPSLSDLCSVHQLPAERIFCLRADVPCFCFFAFAVDRFVFQDARRKKSPTPPVTLCVAYGFTGVSPECRSPYLSHITMTAEII